jgi:AP-5 complex subunit mu-1
LRGFWIISDVTGELLYARRYLTVEKRVSRTKSYVKLPSDTELANAVFEKLKNPQQTENHSLILSLNGNSIWPVIFIYKPVGIIQVAIPMIEAVQRTESTKDVPIHELPLFNLPFVTATVTLLNDLAPLIEAHSGKYSPQTLKQLNSPLSIIMPFGKPLDTILSNMHQTLTVPFSNAGEDLQFKRPGWVPYLYKGGKQSMEFHVQELIRAIQYDRDKAPNTIQIQGTIHCKICLEGFPEVTVPFQLVENMPGKLGHITTHASVQNLDHEKSKRFVFSNVMDVPFHLCRYEIVGVDKMPMRGFYQMKEISKTEVKLLLQLKLDDYVLNQFQYCRVIVPFFNHGLIDTFSAVNTAGELTIREDKKALIWDIGTKWTSRNKEVALPASIFFKDLNNNSGDDPFCFNANCYAKMEFSLINFGHINIIPKNITLVKSANVQKITVDRTFTSSEYIIWNSWGKVKYAWNPSLNQIQ